MHAKLLYHPESGVSTDPPRSFENRISCYRPAINHVLQTVVFSHFRFFPHYEVPFRGVDVDNGGSNSATGDGIGGGDVNDDTVAAIGGGPAPCANRGGDGIAEADGNGDDDATPDASPPQSKRRKHP